MRQIFRGLLRRITTSDGDQQVGTIDRLPGETFTGIEHRQPYGFEAHPPPDSVAVIASLDGTADNSAILSIDGVAHRPRTLAMGEVAVYGPADTPTAPAAAATQRIQMMGDGTILIRSGTRIILESGGSRIEIDAAGIRIRGARIDLN